MRAFPSPGVTTMSSAVDRSLLPDGLRSRLDAGDVTNGEYHTLLRHLPTPALVDHARVYRSHMGPSTRRQTPADPVSMLWDFVLPELCARLGGAPVRRGSVGVPGPFWDRLNAIEADRLEAHRREAVRCRDELAAMDDDSFIDVVESARLAVPNRWSPEDLVYEASLLWHITPELVRRLRHKTTTAGQRRAVDHSQSTGDR